VTAHRRGRGVALLLAAAVALGAARAAGEEDVPSRESQREERRAKSHYIYNFARLATWPRSAFEADTSPFVVGLVGEDPLGEELDAVLHERRVGERDLVLLRFSDPRDVRPVHLLVFGKLPDGARTNILAACRHEPVLTLGLEEGLASAGGVASFFHGEQGRIRFEVNVDAAKRSRIGLSSQLLKLARIIEEGRETPR